MGYMRHHAIIVTGIDLTVIGKGNAVESAHKKAIELFPDLSEITPSEVNGYLSFFIPPDGSKEGWGESDEGDKRRAAFLDHLKTYTYEDGSSPISWVEVQYGDDERETKVTHDNDEDRRA